MTEFFFADVDLPFHVWVRERAVGSGFRWVLREAPRSQEGGAKGEGDASAVEEPPQTSKGG